MNTKKNWNTGKIVVLLGAVLIMILVALWCGHLLKSAQKNQTTSTDPTQTEITTAVSVNQPEETVTTELIPSDTTTIPMTDTQQTMTETLMTETIPNEELNNPTSTGEFRQYVIKLANPQLTIYSQPTYSGTIVGVITDRGSYVITDETTDDEGNKWGLLDSGYGWINLADARSTIPDDTALSGTDSNNSEQQTTTQPTSKRNPTNTNTNNNNNNNNNSNNNGNGGLTGVDADGDGWDDGWNPDAWCIICGYDSYWNEADGCYHCSQGHTWNY